MSTIASTQVLAPERKRRSVSWRMWRFVREKPLGAAGALIVIVLVLVAIFADAVAPHDPNTTNIRERFQGPSAEHLFGTDSLGRDILSRVIHGSRLSLLVGISASVISSLAGGLIGLASAYFGGRLDGYIQRIADVLLGFPSLILLLALVAALGPSLGTVIIALSIGNAPRVNRLVRSVALSVKESTYIEAERSIGAGHLRILLRHLAPNCMAPWLIYSATLFGGMILAEATLAFLGLGVPPPSPSWGRDLNDAQAYFLESPWMAIWPGVAMSLVVFGVNLLGDALRDMLDPRLRQR